ncbi:Protein of unknown function [Desulfonatronum zhilinae]|nr:Protein of unknown function [Desulfonatronum zhilinae]
MIRIAKAHYLDNFKVELTFSDGKSGVFDGRQLLERKGPLLEPLHDESFFRRLFIEAGALSWPNGLELSPAKLHETCHEVIAV